MKTLLFPLPRAFRALVFLAGLAGSLAAQESPQFKEIQRLTNGEVLLKLIAPTGLNYRIEASAFLPQWQPLITLKSSGSLQHTDTAAPFFISQFYRALQLNATNVLTGDHLVTDAGDVVIQPINHASFVLSWNGKMIYNDPVGGAARFTGLARADLILVTHAHGDHFDAATITVVRGSNGVVIAPQAVYQSLPSSLKSVTTVLTNSAATDVLGLSIEAVPMYNLTTANHIKGVGNGYILTVGGKRIYISGDTEDIPEMRALRDIDVAFVCMNLPFTMSVDKAASAVREFRPRVVYPFHYSGYTGNDIIRFKQMVGADLRIEVRLRKWY